MKRIVLSAVASFDAGCHVAAGQAAPLTAPSAPRSAYSQVDWQKPGKHVVVKKKVVVRENYWRNGQKYSSWNHRQLIRDYRHYGLRRPGPGQEWIRVDNDYLPVSIVSGLIFGAVAAH